MSDDTHDVIEWNPFDYVEEDRDVLEKIAAARRVAPEFPAHLLTTDPDVAREVVRKAKAEKVVENAKDYSWGAPEMVAREIDLEEWPRSAKTLNKKLGHDWQTTGWLMRGPVISSQNRERLTKTCFVLAADHPDGRRFRTVFYEKEAPDGGPLGKWDRKSDWIYTPDRHVNWTAPANVKALEEYAS